VKIYFVICTKIAMLTDRLIPHFAIYNQQAPIITRP
jgi:hypothetical protein